MLLSCCRLLDLGFQEDLEAIIALLGEQKANSIECKTVLVSATLTQNVQRLAKLSLRDPVWVLTSSLSQEGIDGGSGAVSQTTEVPILLQQFCIRVPTRQRLITLVAFLKWKAKR